MYMKCGQQTGNCNTTLVVVGGGVQREGPRISLGDGPLEEAMLGVRPGR